MSDKWKINLVGYDWESCYLHDSPKRKKQVLEDLEKFVQEKENRIIGEIIEIDVKDHSFASEFFTPIAIFERSILIKMEYSGGAS